MGAQGPPARQTALRTAGIIVGLAIVYALVPLHGPYWWVGALVGGVILLTIAPMAVIRIKRVLVSERPVLEAVEALALLLTMLITGFAGVYYALNRTGAQLSGLDTRLDSIYFTVTTFSTVGFGDITALSQVARAVVSLQILFDLVFVGLVVRVLMTAARHRALSRPGLGLDATPVGSPRRDDATGLSAQDDA